MCNDVNDFKLKYPKAIIVNYDIASIYGYGLSYRTATDRVEIFRKDNGKYLEYPNIQPYSKLNSDKYKMFIIKDNRMFELGVTDKPNCFKKVKELDIDVSIFDSVFKSNEERHKKSANRKSEPIYKIEE